MKNASLYKTTKININIPNEHNNTRHMTDEQLRQLFDKGKNPTNEDHVAIIDSKVNRNEMYTKEELEDILEAYYHHDPETASIWIRQEKERQSNELIRIENEVERGTIFESLKNSAIEKLAILDSLTEQFNLSENERRLSETQRQQFEETRKTNENTRISNEIQRQQSISNMQTTVDNKVIEVTQAKNDMMQTVTTEIDAFDQRLDEMENVNPNVELVQARVDLGGTIHNDIRSRLDTDFNLKSNKNDVYTRQETDNLINSKTQINDSITSSTSVWSSQKTNTELNNKSNIGHTHAMSDITGLVLNADNVTITDTNNYFTATNVEGALNEIFEKVDRGRVALIQNINEMIDTI